MDSLQKVFRLFRYWTVTATTLFLSHTLICIVCTSQKLLRTVETSRSDLKDSTRAVEAEARLRANLGKLREECNTLATAADETKRQQALLADELKFVKAKANRLTQEKNKIERDSRAAIALARSLDSGTNSDVDFYKRKVQTTERMDRRQCVCVCVCVFV